MLARDVAAVHALSRAVHPDFPESLAVFAEKRDLFPAGCFVLEADGAIAGYGFAHPWRSRGVPELDTPLRALPAQSDALFVHDVALHRDARGAGSVGPLLRAFESVARGARLARMVLVAVNGTAAYWARADFAAVRDDAMQAGVRDAYGPDALAMERVLGME